MRSCAISTCGVRWQAPCIRYHQRFMLFPRQLVQGFITPTDYLLNPQHALDIINALRICYPDSKMTDACFGIYLTICANLPQDKRYKQCDTVLVNSLSQGYKSKLLAPSHKLLRCVYSLTLLCSCCTGGFDIRCIDEPAISTYSGCERHSSDKRLRL